MESTDSKGGWAYIAGCAAEISLVGRTGLASDFFTVRASLHLANRSQRLSLAVGLSLLRRRAVAAVYYLVIGPQTRSVDRLPIYSPQADLLNCRQQASAPSPSSTAIVDELDQSLMHDRVFHFQYACHTSICLSTMRTTLGRERPR